MSDAWEFTSLQTKPRSSTEKSLQSPLREILPSPESILASAKKKKKEQQQQKKRQEDTSPLKTHKVMKLY